MKKSVKNTLMAAAATAAMAVAFVGVGATSASAINVVGGCAPNGEFLQVTGHLQGDEGDVGHPCFANGGEYTFPVNAGDNMVITHIWTGNNHVQYFSDGRWQPDQPIGPNTDYDVHGSAPGGGAVAPKIRIV